MRKNRSIFGPICLGIVLGVGGCKNPNQPENVYTRAARVDGLLKNWYELTPFEKHQKNAETLKQAAEKVYKTSTNLIFSNADVEMGEKSYIVKLHFEGVEFAFMVPLSRNKITPQEAEDLVIKAIYDHSFPIILKGNPYS